jgi:hypothetical protein
MYMYVPGTERDKQCNWAEAARTHTAASSDRQYLNSHEAYSSTDYCWAQVAAPLPLPRLEANTTAVREYPCKAVGVPTTACDAEAAVDTTPPCLLTLLATQCGLHRVWMIVSYRCLVNSPCAPPPARPRSPRPYLSQLPAT